MMKRVILVAVSIGMSAIAMGDCANMPTQKVASPDGKHVLVLEESGSYRIVSKVTGKPTHQGHIELYGHHADAFLFNNGQFATVDGYEGVAVYDPAGKELERVPGSALSYWRVGRWTCHSEGRWLVGAAWDREGQVVLDVAAGPDAVIALDTGKASVLLSGIGGQGRFLLMCLVGLGLGGFGLYARKTGRRREA